MKRLKLLLIFVFLGCAGTAHGQACTNPADGSGNHCSPVVSKTAVVAEHGDGSAADGSWAFLNRASDTNSSDLGCYYAGQITPADHNLSIVQKTGGTYTCGQSDTTQGPQNFLSGSMIWQNLNYKPSEMSSGKVTIEAKIKWGAGWTALWLLGGSGDTSSAAGCQYTSINLSWDNIGNCAWSSDAQDSAEVDIFEPGNTNTEVRQSYYNILSHTGCTQNASSDFTTNYHVYHLDWSNSAMHWQIDGVAGCSGTTDIPVNPMFLIIENRENSTSLGGLPATVTVQYVQVCDGSPCTAPGNTGGNTVYLDAFSSTSSQAPQPPTNLRAIVQ